MAIIRVTSINDGKKMKQSLCIAKIVAQMYKLEIIQDFGTQTTLGKAIDIAEAEARAKKCPEMMRILRLIQAPKCQKLKGNGLPGCNTNCNELKLSQSDPYSVFCVNCHHAHTPFNSYADLDKLPAILILVNNGRMGDTFPPTFIALDDRAVDGVSDVFLTPFIQEKGRLCRYWKKSHGKLPFMYLSEDLYDQLDTALNIDCSIEYSFIEKEKLDPKVKFVHGPNGSTLELIGNHADIRLDKSKNRVLQFLVRAPPQIGKTGAALSYIRNTRLEISEELEIESSSDESDTEDQPIEYDSFSSTVPHWEAIRNLDPLPKSISSGKYNRKFGTYNYPVLNPPAIPLPKKRKIKKSIPKVVPLKYKLRTYTSNHIKECNDKVCKVFESNEEPLELSGSIEDIEEDCLISIPGIDSLCHEHYYNLFHDKIDIHIYTFILTPSKGRASTARLNWNHLIYDQTDFETNWKPYFHFVFVRADEYLEYKDKWGGQIGIVKLPHRLPGIQETAETGGIGFSRRFIQIFAHDMKIKRFYMADDNIIYLKDLHDLKHGAKDENVISMSTLDASVSKIGSEKHQVPEKHLQFQRHKDVKISESNTVAAFSGPLQNFGIIGFRKTRGTPGNFKS